jgi:hypothetical protein
MKPGNLFLIPRILTILFVLFMTLFALDSFSGNIAVTEKVSGFVIHIIPEFILIIILILSWRFPLIGGLLFILNGLIWTIFFKTYTKELNFFILSFPLILIGTLFIIFYFINKRRKN